MSNPSPLTALSFLRVNWEQNEGQRYDHIDNFLPFVAHSLIYIESEPVAIDQLRDRVFDDFGIRIPRNALNTILSRAVRGGASA